MGEQSTLENKALWLSSFEKPLELIKLPVPEAGAGSVVVKVLNTVVFPYADDIHRGHLPVFNLALPLVPHPSHVGRVHAIGPDAVRLKQGDLVYFTAFITARDDDDVFMIQGHHGGEDPVAKKLMKGEWRDGALQQYQKIPLENAFLLDDQRMTKELGYTPADLHEISFYAMGVGPICESAKLQPGETYLVGPATGTYGGICSEVALAIGANVVAIARSEKNLKRLQEQLGNHERFRYVVMTGDEDKDTKAILAATPGNGGVEVYNDWASGSLEGSPYFDTAFKCVKPRGRIILSGGPAGTISIPYAYFMHQSMSLIGKVGVERSGIKLTIKMVESGVLKLGKRGGAKHVTYSLEEHQAAFEEAKKGGFKQYVDIVPNPW